MRLNRQLLTVLKESEKLTGKDLEDMAMWLYDNHNYDYEWDNFTDDELVELQQMCFITDENPGGRAFDDEVYEAISRRPNGKELFDRAKKSFGAVKEGYLEPKFDSAKSFYNKAMTDESDTKLYSYGTLVAEVKDGQPVIYNAQSVTTVRHIKEFLKQKGFEDDVILKAIKDFKKNKINEAFDTIQYWGSKNQFGYTVRQLRVDYENKTFETGSFRQSVDHKVSNKEIDRKIEELEALGFTNLNKQHAKADLERTEELYKNTPDEKHKKDYDSAKFNASRYGITKESEEKRRKLKPNSDREKVSDNIQVMNYKGTYIVTYHGHNEKEFDNQEDAFKFAEKLKKKYKE